MALNTAIRHLKNGDWAKAHAVVQNDSSHMGCWAHGIVHMLEGDLGNARYWYRRAGRPFPRERDASAEIDALVTEMKSQANAASTQQHASAASSQQQANAASPQQQAQDAAPQQQANAASPQQHVQAAPPPARDPPR